MRNYVRTIVDEFARDYGRVAEGKRSLDQLDAFMDLRDPRQPVYETEFKLPLESATLLLRKELRRLTG